MSIDVLQEKIRKTKSPIMLELSASVSDLPAHLLEQYPSEAAAYGRACRELLEALKTDVPAVRVSFSSFALLGADGLTELSGILKYAGKLGYYVVLDAPEILGVRSAENAARVLFGEKTQFPCSGVILGSYLGSDCVKPFLSGCKENKKTVFVAIRTANRSAAELQEIGRAHV